MYLTIHSQLKQEEFRLQLVFLQNFYYWLREGDAQNFVITFTFPGCPRTRATTIHFLFKLGRCKAQVRALSCLCGPQNLEKSTGDEAAKQRKMYLTIHSQLKQEEIRLQLVFLQNFYYWLREGDAQKFIITFTFRGCPRTRATMSHFLLKREGCEPQLRPLGLSLWTSCLHPPTKK